MTTIPDTATTVVRASHVPGPPQGQWTYSDYAQLPDLEGFQYEIIAGVLYMAPAPTPEHERVGALIIARLVTAVDDTGFGAVYVSPDIDVGATTVRPDAVVVLKEHAGIVDEKKLIGPPDLVVEIASPSTADYDRDPEEGKAGAYARLGIPEYWIVDPVVRTIEVLVLEHGRYRSYGLFHGNDHVSSAILPGIILPAYRFFPRNISPI